jgi:NAD(P)-dependent dehydrogenase (short-subunit alcohol dehydrogenase family)
MAETNFNGRVVLISGGGTGIGRGTALAFARANAVVAVCGRRLEPLQEVVSAITAAGGKAIALSADVTVPADCQRLIAETERQLGALHILVNNAGIARLGSLPNTSDSDIQQMLSTNLAGLMLLSKYAIPALAKHAKNGGASILNIASSVAHTPLKDFSVYSATKAAVVHFTRCLGLDLAPQKIRVNCICPGVVETPIFASMLPKAAVGRAMKMYADATPLGRVGQPEDIGRTAVFLSAPEAEWITGAVVTVDGGIGLT